MEPCSYALGISHQFNKKPIKKNVSDLQGAGAIAENRKGQDMLPLLSGDHHPTTAAAI
jgi:hypothetical protein